jgi:hypothetical protein
MSFSRAESVFGATPPEDFCLYDGGRPPSLLWKVALYRAKPSALPLLRAEMGPAGEDFVLRPLTKERVIEDVVALYRELVGPPETAAGHALSSPVSASPR